MKAPPQELHKRDTILLGITFDITSHSNLSYSSSVVSTRPTEICVEVELPLVVSIFVLLIISNIKSSLFLHLLVVWQQSTCDQKTSAS